MLPWILTHKLRLTILAVVIIGGVVIAVLWQRQQDTPVRYVMAAVTKGTLITNISGSGQVAASNQIDLQAKASGTITTLPVTVGQTVTAGQLIARIDATEAYKSVRDAATSLDSAQLSLKKLQQPADDLSLMQAEHALTQAQNTLAALKLSQNTEYQQAINDLVTAQEGTDTAYTDAFNAVANAFIDLPSVIDGLHSIIFNQDFNPLQANVDWYYNQLGSNDDGQQDMATIYRLDLQSDYAAAVTTYDTTFALYKTVARTDSQAALDNLNNQTIITLTAITEAVKSVDSYIDFIANDMEENDLTTPSAMTTHQSSLNTYTSTVNKHLSAVLAVRQEISDSQNTITKKEQSIQSMAQNNPRNLTAAEATVNEKERSLADLKAGTDALDLQAQELNVRQRQDTLADAREQLADYSITAPTDGVIADISVGVGDSASAGSIIATFITKQKVATLSLNEVDVAQVAVGQKATLTFDAVSDLTIAGTVATVDILGTVSQGVVSYEVSVAFDTEDERVKPGMTVMATIITNAKTDVLTVSNSAIKTSDDTSYVEMPNEDIDTTTLDISAGLTLTQIPKQQAVEIGLVNDTMSEITNGLNEGDLVIIKTVTEKTTSSATTSSSRGLLDMGGGGPPGV